MLDGCILSGQPFIVVRELRAMEKNEAGAGGLERWRSGILNRMMRQGLTERVTYEQRPEEGE